MDRKLLEYYGIDYEKGLRNCMGNEDFFKKILSMFLKDTCFQNALEAHSDKAYEDLFSFMHELKGVSGSVALMELYETIVPLVELLRGGNVEDSEVDRMFAEVEAAYSRTCEGITLGLSE